MYRVGNQTFNTIQEARAYDYATNGTIDNVRSVAAPVRRPPAAAMPPTPKSLANSSPISTYLRQLFLLTAYL